jgi:hypothetical protein
MPKKKKTSTSNFLLNSPLKDSDVDLSRSKETSGRIALQFEVDEATEIKESLRGRTFSDSAALLRGDRKR